MTTTAAALKVHALRTELDAIEAKAMLDDELTKRSILDFANQIGLPEGAEAEVDLSGGPDTGSTRLDRRSKRFRHGSGPTAWSKRAPLAFHL